LGTHAASIPAEVFARPVEAALELVLHFVVRATVHLARASLLDLLWLGQTFVHHVLVVTNHVHLSVELRVEVVLAAGELIPLFHVRSGVGRAPLSETVV
jgi:hypothetical protein